MSEQMDGYTCLTCGFHTNGDLDDFLGHIRGAHDIDVKAGNIHYAHCNESNCERSNGHGRRINSFRSLQAHLERDHNIDIE